MYSGVLWELEDGLVSVDVKVAFHLVYLPLPSPSFSPGVCRDPRRRMRRSMSTFVSIDPLIPV